MEVFSALINLTCPFFDFSMFAIDKKNIFSYNSFNSKGAVSKTHSALTFMFYEKMVGLRYAQSL